MILKHLSLLNYKNIKIAETDLSPKLNCFFGLNGMGKTNFLDAVYYLSFCKSAANSVDSQNIMHDEGFFMIRGTYEDENGSEMDVFCGLKRKQKKVFKKNGKEYRKFSEHIGQIPLVMVSPSDSSLIAGGSEERRRFIDLVISQYDKEYLNSLIRYEKALLQRNTLLRAERPADSEDYDIWEDMMAIYGEAVSRKRMAFIEDFKTHFSSIYSYISQDSENVGLEYVSHCLEGDLREMLRQSRQKDLIMGYSLKGIHKDDLTMMLDGYPIKKEGSQGQNKTYLISLKLAQFNYLRKFGATVPILLLDDIFDRLDSRRVEQIIKLVAGDDFGQIFITDTDKERFEPILRQLGDKHKVFRVEEGEVLLYE